MWRSIGATPLWRALGVAFERFNLSLNIKMKIWHLSDTHGLHDQIRLPEDLDIACVIHSGDAGNHRDTPLSMGEMWRFLEWFRNLPYEKKIFVPGNHDCCLERGVFPADEWASAGVDLLVGASTEILCGGKSYTAWGGPWTPTFGKDWAFNRDRGKIDRYWQEIPDCADIVVTHGPPLGVLDWARDRGNSYDMVGDKSLRRHIDRVSPRAHLFGHVHNDDPIVNQGVLYRGGTIYSNASCVTDRKIGEGPTSHGNVIRIEL